MMQVAIGKERFEITDLSSAEWVMEKLVDLANREKEVQEQYEKMIARYDSWKKDELDNIADSRAYFEGLLAPWVQQELEGSKKKSINLPSGKAGFRKGKEVWTIAGGSFDKHSEKLIKVAKQYAPEFVEQTESVRWADFKKTLKPLDDGRACTADGEIIDDFYIRQEEPTFYVTPNTKEG